MHTSDEIPGSTDRKRSEVSIQDLTKRIHGMNDEDVYNILVAVLHSIRDRLPNDQAAIFERKMPDLFKKAFRESWQPKHTKNGNFIADVGDRLEVSQRLNLSDSIRAVMAAIKSRFRTEEIKNLSVLQEIILELGQAGI